MVWNQSRLTCCMGWQRKAKRSCFTGRLMSALGQKRTCAAQQVMSAKGQKQTRAVHRACRFSTEADVRSATISNEGGDLRFAHLPARPVGQGDSGRSALLRYGDLKLCHRLCFRILAAISKPPLLRALPDRQLKYGAYQFISAVQTSAEECRGQQSLQPPAARTEAPPSPESPPELVPATAAIAAPAP